MVLVMSELDTAQLPRTGWLDRRRDLAGWLLTPLITFVVAPLTAGIVGVVVLLTGGYGRTPVICGSALAHNGCEETTYGILDEHIIFFVTVWLLLWAVPWWRGLRPVRVLLAIVAFAVLIAAPIRMAGWSP
jgi:hypothetical protein